MGAITIFNLIVNIAVIGYVLYRFNRVSFSIDRTFWCNKPVSVEVWWHDGPVRERGSVKRIINIPLCNRDKAEKWDKEMFESGEYKIIKDNNRPKG